jgi:conjugative relaxase-like TrwC/TraI family protein
VISIHPLGRGPKVADYYLTRRECDDLGYYVGRDQLPGRWVGSGAAALGLRHDFGPGDGEMLRGFLSGRGLDGSVLVPSVMRRDDKGEPYDARRVGFDVTCSAPKSVSVLYALGNADVAGQVAAAHRTAVREALEVLERLSARAARGHQGDGHRARRIPTSGLIGAAFDHDTSRLLDPQLHTHVVIANVVYGIDGRWSALDSQTMVRQATTVSYLYQAALRAELTRRLGVAWTDVEKGIAEIDGIPREVLRAFSKRRDQIERALDDRGLSGRAAAQAACLATRPAKQHEDTGTLRDRWLAESTSLGFDARDVSTLLRRDHRSAAVIRETLAGRVLGPDGVTRDTSTFDRGELVREVCQHLPPGADVTAPEILAIAGALLREDDVVPVLSNDGVAYTTVDMLAVEQAALDAVTARAAEHLAVVEGFVVDTALTSTGLRPDQVGLVRDITLSGRGVEVITGPAGSGKTRALATAVASWTSTGVDVRGVALAAITADGLRAATGAPSTSLARLLSHPDRHVPTDGVLLLDEAGMVGTRQLAGVIELTRRMRCKLVLVGDPAQLPEMEAGGLFAALSRRDAAIHLEGHHRQVEPWEADALEAVRAGQTSAAFDAYTEHGRLHTDESSESLRDELVADYLLHRAEVDNPRQVLILVRTRAQADRLNHVVRSRLLAEERLSATSMRVQTDRGAIDFRVGDEVIVTRNLHSQAVFNGTRATVTGVGLDAVTITIGEGRRLELPRSLLGHDVLDHGYALTIHKAQGLTVDRALLWADPGLYREAGYVGLSRAREATHVYVPPAFDPIDDLDCGAPRRNEDRSGAEALRLVSDLERSHQQRLALDHSPSR